MKTILFQGSISETTDVYIGDLHYSIYERIQLCFNGTILSHYIGILTEFKQSPLIDIGIHYNKCSKTLHAYSFDCPLFRKQRDNIDWYHMIKNNS